MAVWKLSKVKKRPLGRIQLNKQIGSSNKYELSKPKDLGKCKEIDVYADTETYYLTQGVEPGKYIGQKDFESKLSVIPVKPLLLVWKVEQENHVLYFDKDSELDMANHFLSQLSYLYNTKRRTPTLWFHNSSYDIRVMANLFKQLDPDLVLYYFCQRKSGSFIRGCMQSPKYNFYCKFGDTLKYDKTMSIENAGDMFGKHKLGGFPYGMCDPELIEDDLEEARVAFTDVHTGERKEYPLIKAMEYAERDVDIMKDLHEWRNELNAELNSVMIEGWDEGRKDEISNFRNRTETQGSHTKRICDEYLKSMGLDVIDEFFRFDLSKYYDSEDAKTIYQWIISSNCGGFTSYNKNVSKYDCKDNGGTIKTFDVNSMYPYIMTGELPFGEIYTTKPINGGTNTTGYCVRLRSCKGKGKLKCLKNEGFGTKKQTDRPFFVEGKYWEFMLKNAHMDYTVEGTYYQNNTKVIANLMKKYYAKRNEYKDLRDKFEEGTPEYELYDRIQHGLKILLNSLYGKMCERGYHINIVFNDLKFETYDNPKKIYPCILTGSFITYRARLKLLSTIKKVLDAGHDFLYADTDSITLACRKGSDLKPIFGEDNKNLGEWKDEGTYDLYLSVFKKKKYFLANRDTKKFKMALSGVPNAKQKIFQKQLKNNFERVVKDMEKIYDPYRNYRMLSCKPNSIMNYMDQTIIVNVDFQINHELGFENGTIEFTEDDYILREQCQ